jgi:putative transposase
MRYRRVAFTGGAYFFTVNLADRSSRLLVDEIDLLRGAILHVKACHPFKQDALVVMPNHLHAVMTLPEDDADFSLRWRLIKAGFSKRLPRYESISQSRSSKLERGIWQRRFWEHAIRDDIDYQRHVDYIHFNPVKHGYVSNPHDWPYSTIHRNNRRKTPRA